MEATTGRTWDGLPCVGLRDEDLSRAAIEDFLRRSEQDPTTSTETVIQNLRLRLPDGKLCNAAALLFLASPSRFLDGVQIKCGRFRGDSPIDFIDERTIEGNVFIQLDEALAFVARNTRQGIKITGRPEREIVPEYPDAAIREAITNAICHRDYAEEGHVQLRIFEGGLEVWNPGRLPSDLSIADMYTAHHSRPRNRKLAGAFYRARLIEQWGTGTLRMVRACEERGMARPYFCVAMGAFVVRFVSSSPTLGGKSECPQSVLTERQSSALDYVRENGSITTVQYQRLGGISERQARYDLRHLVSAKILIRQGKGPSTRYIAAKVAE